jgi:HK97 family phage major capsid protein
MKKLRAKLLAAQLRARTLGEVSEMSAEQEKEFDAALAEVKTIEDAITAKEERSAKLAAMNASVSATETRLAQPTTKPVDTDTRSDITVGENRAKNVFETSRDFFSAVLRSSVTKQADPRFAQYRAATGLSEAVPSDGGFLLPENVVSEIYQAPRMIGGNVLPKIDMLPLTQGNSAKIPAADASSHASGSVAGGIISYWGNEAPTMTASKPQFRQMSLELNKVYGLVYVTDDMLEDMDMMAAYINKNVPKAIELNIEDKIFNGTGKGQPLGILKSPCLVSQAKTTSQTKETITALNLFNMYSRQLAGTVGNSVWYYNQDALPQLMTLTQGNVNLWLPGGQIKDAPYGMLLGRPMFPSEYCATLGTVGDIILADMSQYQGIEKKGIKSNVSIHVEFLTDQSVFKFSKRFDGQPKLDKAITPLNSAVTQSPFVALATRG